MTVQAVRKMLRPDFAFLLVEGDECVALRIRHSHPHQELHGGMQLVSQMFLLSAANPH